LRLSLWKPRSEQRRYKCVDQSQSVSVNRHSGCKQFDWYAREIWWIGNIIKVRF